MLGYSGTLRTFPNLGQPLFAASEQKATNQKKSEWLLHDSRNAQHDLRVISWKIGGIHARRQNKVGEPDRSKVAKDQDYEVA